MNLTPLARFQSGRDAAIALEILHEVGIEASLVEQPSGQPDHREVERILMVPEDLQEDARATLNEALGIPPPPPPQPPLHQRIAPLVLISALIFGWLIFAAFFAG